MFLVNGNIYCFNNQNVLTLTTGNPSELDVRTHSLMLGLCLQ